ncbi:tetratricopeptide repeat protein [Bremerella sp. P1]|uniref:tetratricopeptide repeat protein n=1 Tax=Bremerella sp. P1 TaxID=3026424 RepID=UPI002367FBEF|nr:tetratricopeptide repeat protein [Bremerella sp. P1]WDI43175.1 tetratricopeptide repeat protein [Bremerella sp. P1]
MTKITPAAICLVAILMLVGCNVEKNGDALVEEGALYHDQGNYAEAIPYFQDALKKPLINYNKSEVLTMIGNCYNELDEYEESIKYHDMAIKEDPQNHMAYVNKGVVCRLIGEFDEAEKMYNKALELEPEYAELHVSLGALYIHQEEYEKAVVHLEKGVELDDSLAVAHSNLAFAYATVGRFDDADRELKKAIVRGYERPELIKERIDSFRAIAEETPAPDGAKAEATDGDQSSDQ